MSIEAMKLALEALEVAANGGGVNFYEYAKDLRQAIAEASENGLYREGYRNGYGFGEAAGKRQAIAEAENQEPVAWMDSDWHYQLHKKGMVVMHKDEGDVLIGKPQPIYTTPQQRTWVGLTDEEIQEIALELPMDAVRITEAKLKEKNT